MADIIVGDDILNVVLWLVRSCSLGNYFFLQKSRVLPAGAIAPQSLPSVRESRLPTFSPDFRPTAEPAHTEDQEPITYSKPATPLESCSEHSSYRQKSLDKVYFAKKSQSNHSKSDGSSNRSSGSRGLLSGRSSISELFSDKAESVGSHRSRNSGKGVLREVGSGSEGARYSSFSGLNVEEMSDNDSFWWPLRRTCLSSWCFCLYVSSSYLKWDSGKCDWTIRENPVCGSCPQCFCAEHIFILE